MNKRNDFNKRNYSLLWYKKSFIKKVAYYEKHARCPLIIFYWSLALTLCHWFKNKYWAFLCWSIAWWLYICIIRIWIKLTYLIIILINLIINLNYLIYIWLILILFLLLNKLVDWIINMSDYDIEYIELYKI